MTTAIQSALRVLSAGETLASAEAHAAVGEIMDGTADPAAVGALLTALHLRGETIEAIVGAAQAMIERAARIRPNRTGLLDTCGTGGSGLKTFNISTAAALVAAAAGVPVAKHGNRAATSSSGSADVLEALGVHIELSPEQVAACIDEVGIGFCYARACHQAMRHVAPIRAQLPFRTIFNLLGPLTNPAGAEFQLLGAGRPETARKLAGALSQLGRRRALVVCGAGRLDEVVLWDRTQVLEVADGRVVEHEWTAATFGLPECRVEELQADSPADSARLIRDVFAGRPGPARDIVIANTAAALMAAERASDPQQAALVATEAIDSDAAARRLEQLVEWTQSRGT